MREARRFEDAAGVVLVRPLLAVSRAEIREYLATLAQPYREDETNADLARTRSRIRHDLIPKLAADYNPNVANALVQLGELARASQQAIRSEVRSICHNTLIHQTRDCLVLKHGTLQTVSSFLRTEVLRFLWQRAGWPELSMSAERWGRMSGLVGQLEIRPTALGAGVELYTERGFLVLRRTTPTETAQSVPHTGETAPHIPLMFPGVTPVPFAGGRIVATTDPSAPRQESISAPSLQPPLFIRRPVAGDRFEPLGLKGNTTPLADFFRARKVSRQLRATTPLVCDARGIVWVVGHRIAERVKITSDTEATIGLSWEPAVDQGDATPGRPRTASEPT
jgi:tRNA(Ile)-lysidine synthase